MTDRVSPAASIDTACSGCGLCISKPLSWLQANDTLVCPDCGKATVVRRYKARASASVLYERLTGMVGGTKGI